MRFPRFFSTLLTSLGLISAALADEGSGVSPDTAKALSELQAIGGEIAAQVAEVRKRSDHPLWQRHLDSVLSLLEADRARVRLGYDLRDEAKLHPMISDSVQFHRKILAGLRGDAGNPKYSLETGNFSLLMAYVSKRDRSVQYYSVSLPANWDAEKAYPLVTILHGVGTHHPLGYVFIHFPATGKNVAKGKEAGGEEITTNSDADLEPHITIRPWGRGNNGYDGFGEFDVHEAIGDLNRRVKTDVSRWYLTGGSMGSVGAWRIAIHRPDLWAAVAPLASSNGTPPLDSPAVENLRGIPFYFQTGSEDGHRVPLTEERAAAVKPLGNEVKVEILPGVGHGIPREETRRTREWMMQFSKEVPTEFSYRLDPGMPLIEARTIIAPWGIKCRPRLTGEPYSFSFKLDREMNTLHLSTEGTDRVQVDPGPLKFESPMSVYLNGAKRYEGPVKTVDLEVASESSGGGGGEKAEAGR